MRFFIKIDDFFPHLHPNRKQLEQEEKSKWKKMLKKLGWVGFLFFLVKGLMWIALALFAGSSIFDGCSS